MFKKSLKHIFILGLVLTCFSFVYAKTSQDVGITTQPPVIDGKLEDAVWKSAAQFTNFKTFKPDYRKSPSQKTIVYMTRDAENLYFAFRCYDTDPQKVKATISKRDTLNGDDWVGLALDTFNDQQTAFCFILNPLGIQVDGMLNLQGNLDSSLDMIWYSKGGMDDQGYVVECKVPLKSIRFPGKKEITMGIMFFRTIVRTSEQASFPMITPEGGGMLTQTQKISVNGLKYNRVLEVLPAFTHGEGQSTDAGELKRDFKETDVSLTGKVGLTSNITLDGTYNPDFSQVEADAGQIDVNLRYQLYYPEKRPFFLEGKENFDFSGNTEDAPLVALVHTRTIVDPILGVKLTGRIGRKTNFTTLYAIDESPGKLKDDDGNFLNQGKNAFFSIMRLRQPLSGDNYIGAFYSGRDFMDGYNRVVGTDGRFRLSKYGYTEFHALGSFTRNAEGGDNLFGHALAWNYQYGSRKFIYTVGVQDLSDNFQVDTGFLTRKNITRLAGFVMYRFYPKSKFFQIIEPFYWSYHIYDKESSLVETVNLFTLRFWLPRDTTFRIDFIGGTEVYAMERFNITQFGAQLGTQITKDLRISAWYRYGGNVYYDPDDPYQGRGNRGGLYLLYHPLEKFSTDIDLSYSDFYRSADSEKIYDYALLRNRTTFQLNKYLFFRGIVEYNTYWKRMTLDFLASFTYIPGTVVHIGYGSIYEKLKWEERDYVTSNRFMEMKRGFFFKVSYLWRL